MASPAEVSTYRQIQRDVVALAYREVLGFWRTLDHSDPIAAVRALERFLPEVIHAYGEMGAAAAADFYEDLRDQSPAARKAYRAVMGEAIPIEQIRASTRWAVGPLFADPKPEKALSNIVSITNRFTRQAGRQTITTNVERDPAVPRYARVPSGDSTCAFCLVLAGRGAVYTSGSDAGHKYHGHCDCEPTPIFPGDAMPYDHRAFEEKYLAAKRAADSGSLKGEDGILRQLRQQEGIR